MLTRGRLCLRPRGGVQCPILGTLREFSAKHTRSTSYRGNRRRDCESSPHPNAVQPLNS
jgi:hypothetical protein